MLLSTNSSWIMFLRHSSVNDEVLKLSYNLDMLVAGYWHKHKYAPWKPLRNSQYDG
jgi:hypothetical protein